MNRRGGKRLGSGRKKGSKARATIEQRATVSDLAKAHTEDALNTLVTVALSSESDAARVSAAQALLDRAYGKPAQSVDAKVDASLTVKIVKFGIDG